MFVHDTDHMTLVEWGGGSDARRLRARLGELDPREVATTIISYEEQCRGWLKYIKKAKNASQMIDAYAKLNKHLDDYRRSRVMGFDDRWAAAYQDLRKLKLKIGSMDLKIAAIALSQNATLLSRNLKDFRQVSGLRVEDWTDHLR
jgi:tRNA(fMet)-specific endonuclease VapC